MTDPYANAAIPQAAAPPPPQGDPSANTGDPYANAALPAATHEADPSLLQQFWAARPHPIEEAKGFVKGVGNSAAGLLDIYGNAPGGAIPGVVPGTQAGAKVIADAIRRHTQIAAPTADSSPDQRAAIAAQEQGEIAETIAEFFALPEAKAEGIAAKIPTLSEHLAQAGELAKFLEKNKKVASLLKIGVKAAQGAARGGAEQAGQTYIKTGGDVEQAAEAGKVGAAFGGVIGAGSGALRETGEAMERAKPKTRTIAGADFETRAKTGNLNKKPLDEVTIDPATAAVDEAQGNIGRTAVANSLNRANASRPVETPPLPPSRQLPAPAGSTPGIRVGPASEPVETAEGELLQPARKKQIGTRVVEGKGPGGFNLEEYETGQTPPPTGEGELTQRGSHREPRFQYLTETRPGSPAPRADVTTGPGTLILTNDGQASSVMKARALKNQIERVLSDSGEVEQMGARQHQALIDQHADLAEQLRRYDEYAASQPHFNVHDVQDAVRNTDSLGDAGQLLKDSHSPFWKAADEASGGKFTDLREEEKYLKKQLYSDTPISDYEKLMDKIEANKQAQLAFFDKYKTTVSPEEWKIARDGYQDGMVLSDLHDLIQTKFNGITRPEEARAIAKGGKLQRVFEGGSFNKHLEKFFNTGTNREVLERTIGLDHMDNLKNIGQLFENAETAKATKSLGESIGAAIRRHRWAAGGVAGLAGYGLGHGIGSAVGAAIGGPLASGTITGTVDHITERLATDPEFAKRFIYAVKNQVSPRFAGALLATRLLSTAANYPEAKKQETTK